MAEFVTALLGFVVRLVLFMAGVLFFAALVGFALLLLLVWTLRAFWARLTGQAVTPWAFRFNRQPPWQRPGQGFGSPSPPSQDDVIDAEVRDVNVVTDVEPKRIDPPRS